MSTSLLATIITGYWLLLSLLLAMSLSDNLPAEFMQRDYTGPITKPRPAAQIAFLTIGVTSFAMFLLWAITSLISHYYDYLLLSTFMLFTGWWFVIMVLAVLLKPTTKKENGIRWVIGIVLVAIIGIGFFAPAIKSISIDFLTKPTPFTATVTERSASTSKYGTTYTVTLDDTEYKVTRGAYAELGIGETVAFVPTEYKNMAFPRDQIKITWFGVVLLILNLLSLSGATAVIGYGFLGKT